LNTVHPTGPLNQRDWAERRGSGERP
jgi:hypothetical protein